MRKNVLIISTLVLLVFVLSACGTEALQTYKDAVKNTNEIKQGQMSFELAIENEYNTEGLSVDAIRQLNYFKEIESKTSVVFKEESKDTKIMSRNYFNFGGMGFDSAFYKNEDTAFIKMPILGKYVVLDGFNREFNSKENQNDDMMENAIDEIKNKWIKILNRKDVVSGNKTLLTTEDGEIKVTQFSINLTGEQIKQLINESLDIIVNNKGVNEIANEVTDEEGNKLEVEKFINDLKDKMNDITIRDFKYTGYIDIDGYIIQEDIELIADFDNAESGEVLSTDLKMQMKHWNIEKEQKFEFPELTKDNTLDQESFDQGMPFMFDDLINKNDGGES
ncbi:hypothetical protein [Brassicibacter mesophilus]|uniref:hypothetical protein n=1 Tax=Brassicibacter mesophilus TaxID=745119 RepID=UPI003D1EF452